jgi:hypothetical protein
MPGNSQKRRTIMSVNGISGATPALTTTPAAIIPPKPAATTTPPSEPYTVKLTGTALAKSLKLAGQNPSQIAQKMGIDIKTVDSYLSIKVATATPAPATPVPTPAPAPQAKQAATDTAATPQAYSPAEEVTEPGAQKAAETAQGKK